MSDDVLFCYHDLSDVIDGQRQGLLGELDGIDDSRILNTDLSALQDYAAEKYQIDLPILGEPEIDHDRTKMPVGRYGGRPGTREGTVQVDAQRFTLEIPFTGDRVLLFCRGSTFTMSPPRGSVSGNRLSMTVIERSPSPEQLNQIFDRFIAEVRQHLEWLRPQVDSWNASIRGVVEHHVITRRTRAAQIGSVAASLKYGLKARPDAPDTFVAPVNRKKVTPTFPPANKTRVAEPILSDEIYRDVLDTLQQMSEVMERSPHAFADMDEEALRFAFLIPLNAKFEGEARGEAFNYGGKTDILITHRGRNIFIAECKIWKGAAALVSAIDQLLGYLSWRDTKAALLLFNRNKRFSDVLQQIDPTVRQHPQCVSTDGVRNETEFAYTFAHRDDPERRLKLTVLAFDIPAARDG